MPRIRTTSETSGDERPFTALVLQGGGALGAYQAGAYESLSPRADTIDWVAGVSIGAINGALIAGNPPERRIERLHAFWERVSLPIPAPVAAVASSVMRPWWNSGAAMWGAMLGVPGFFAPRPWWEWWPHPPASFYATGPLRETLLELVDFDRINDGPMRFSVDAVDVETGNFVHFDNRRVKIRPEHVMASGALPPGFPAVAIEGRHYWDGGLVSNTPLALVMEQLEGHPVGSAKIFQIDLFSARGQVPDRLEAVAEREKDIRYSSRTRLVSDQVRERHQLRKGLADMAALLSEKQRARPEVRALLARNRMPGVTLVHVIHRRKPYESQNKDYEFSQRSMREHWIAGMSDMQSSLALLDAHRPPREGGFCVIDHQAPESVRRFGE